MIIAGVESNYSIFLTNHIGNISFLWSHLFSMARFHFSKLEKYLLFLILLFPFLVALERKFVEGLTDKNCQKDSKF